MDMMHRESNETFKQMHLLDAFLRESARLNPLDACKQKPQRTEYYRILGVQADGLSIYPKEGPRAI